MNIEISKQITTLLSKDERVIFAYLFGSLLKQEITNDIDVAIYCTPTVMDNPFVFTSDIKIELSKITDLSPDQFDITLINYLLIDEKIDSLLILGEIFDGLLIVDRDPDLRTNIIERVSAQFRESAGLITELLS